MLGPKGGWVDGWASPRRFLSDTTDIALYWYFLVLAWLPLYAMIYLCPRFG